MLSIISIVATLFVAGLLLWAAEQFPLDPTIRTIIRVVVIVFVVLWLLSGLGLLTNLNV